MITYDFCKGMRTVPVKCFLGLSVALALTACGDIKFYQIVKDDKPDTRHELVVTIVFSGAGCPLFTVFNAQPGGTPGVGRGDTIAWEAQALPGQTLPTGLKYAVIFDPIKGGSRVIGDPNTPPKHLDPADRLPDNITFKYTIAKVINNSGTIDRLCPPLDPMIRVL